MYNLWWICIGFLFLLQNPYITESTVIGIDLGAEWIKVSFVKPKGLDIALNEAAGRKTPTVVAFNRGEMVIGADAANLIVRSPQTTFGYASLLLGRKFDDPVIEELKDTFFFNYKLTENKNRNSTFSITMDESTHFTPEDLVAILLSYSKDIAAKSSGTGVKDAVIIIPPYLTEAQRRAVIDAAKLADLNVLSLVNKGTAVAINFGIERQFEENATNVIFYDMGAGSTTATLVSYKASLDGKKNKTIGQLQVQSIAWDQTLGGKQFDRRLALHFAEKVKKTNWKRSYN